MQAVSEVQMFRKLEQSLAKKVVQYFIKVITSSCMRQGNKHAGLHKRGEEPLGELV